MPRVVLESIEEGSETIQGEKIPPEGRGMLLENPKVKAANLWET